MSVDKSLTSSTTLELCKSGHIHPTLFLFARFSPTQLQAWK